LVTKFRANPWAVLLVVSLGFFMTLLDLTIVNIAIPDMITRLHASLDDILWVINAYALVLAVLVITAGRSATWSARGSCSPSALACSPPRRPRAAWPRAQGG
jgi:MFS family permease